MSDNMRTVPIRVTARDRKRLTEWAKDDGVSVEQFVANLCAAERVLRRDGSRSAVITHEHVQHLKGRMDEITKRAAQLRARIETPTAHLLRCSCGLMFCGSDPKDEWNAHLKAVSE